jgi:hypothetical protein
MNETTPGRQPIQIVEIDQRVCSLTYGVAPCTASLSGNDKCFNTYTTCQDRTNYSATTSTIRFCKSSSNMPIGEKLIPSVTSVSTLPTQLNFAGMDTRTGPLGRRGSITVGFKDHPYSDILTDPYLSDRTYDPLGNGTFWSKWLARNQFYVGWNLRVYDGYIGQSIGSMVVRRYIIERISGPDSNGSVSVVAKDVLKEADNDRAVAPKLTNGTLAANMTDSSTANFTVLNASIADYPSFIGFLRIDDEIIGYGSRVQSGTSVIFQSVSIPFTPITRGRFGTTAAAHSAGTRVQRVLAYGQVLAWDIVYDLLTTWGGISPSLIDKSAWDAEGNLWLPDIRFTAYISEPTGIADLVAEVCQQGLFNIWWDDRAQTIRMRAIRPPTDPVPLIDDEGNIIADSYSLQERDDDRLTEIWLYLYQRDVSKRLNEEANFRQVRVRIDSDAASANEYGDRRIKRIYSRWITTDAVSIAVTAKLLTFYRDTPRIVTIELDAKDRALWTGDIVDVRHRAITSDIGGDLFQRYIVISAQEVKSGETVRYELQSFGPRTNENPTGDAFSFWTEAGMTTYASATADERLVNAFWGEADGTMPGGDPGYYWN